MPFFFAGRHVSIFCCCNCTFFLPPNPWSTQCAETTGGPRPRGFQVPGEAAGGHGPQVGLARGSVAGSQSAGRRRWIGQAQRKRYVVCCPLSYKQRVRPSIERINKNPPLRIAGNPMLHKEGFRHHCIKIMNVKKSNTQQS